MNWKKWSEKKRVAIGIGKKEGYDRNVNQILHFEHTSVVQQTHTLVGLLSLFFPFFFFFFYPWEMWPFFSSFFQVEPRKEDSKCTHKLNENMQKCLHTCIFIFRICEWIILTIRYKWESHLTRLTLTVWYEIAEKGFLTTHRAMFNVSHANWVWDESNRRMSGKPPQRHHDDHLQNSIHWVHLFLSLSFSRMINSIIFNVIINEERTSTVGQYFVCFVCQHSDPTLLSCNFSCCNCCYCRISLRSFIACFF